MDQYYLVEAANNRLVKKLLVTNKVTGAHEVLSVREESPHNYPVVTLLLKNDPEGSYLPVHWFHELDLFQVGGDGAAVSIAIKKIIKMHEDAIEDFISFDALMADEEVSS